MTEPRVVLDACVLSPQSLKDFLLSQAEYGQLFQLIWSDYINSEWIINICKKNPQLEFALRSCERDMNDSFPEANVSGQSKITKLKLIASKMETINMLLPQQLKGKHNIFSHSI